MDAQGPTRFFSKGIRDPRFEGMKPNISCTLVFHNRFNHHEADWGFHNFMEWDILFDDEQPYVVNDKLVIECIIQLKKDPTGVLWHSFQV